MDKLDLAVALFALPHWCAAEFAAPDHEWKDTGEELWKTKLPAGEYATPATYEVNGKQYVVIAAGGGKMGTKSGDSYVAFALP